VHISRHSFIYPVPSLRAFVRLTTNLRIWNPLHQAEHDEARALDVDMSRPAGSRGFRYVLCPNAPHLLQSQRWNSPNANANANGFAAAVRTQASLATFSPGPSYSIGIPSSSTISQSSAGGIYFQLSAPTSYQWVGLGIGEQMQGATIFVMYANGLGNVTISARDGDQGHVEPAPDSSLQSGVTLLAGSGVVNGRLIANVHCMYTVYKLEAQSLLPRGSETRKEKRNGKRS
jgi:Cytochrome domain of cellobiose dehydrogenase